MKSFFAWVLVPIAALGGIGYLAVAGPPSDLSPDQSLFDIRFLAVIIALAAYVSGVRIALLNAARSHSTQAKGIILSLIPGDLNLIAAGLLLAIRLFAVGALDQDERQWFELRALFLFIYGAVYLALQHVFAWGVTYHHFLRGKNPSQDQRPAPTDKRGHAA